MLADSGPGNFFDRISAALALAIRGDMAAKGVLVGRANRSLPNQNNMINFAPAYIASKADVDSSLSIEKIIIRS